MSKTYQLKYELEEMVWVINQLEAKINTSGKCNIVDYKYTIEFAKIKGFEVDCNGILTYRANSEINAGRYPDLFIFKTKEEAVKYIREIESDRIRKELYLTYNTPSLREKFNKMIHHLDSITVCERYHFF